MTTSKPRVSEIDLAKGVGICLVVLGHSLQLVPSHHVLLYNCIYAFHMPLFFFLSGLTFSGKLPFGAFVRKKLHGLIVPAVLFSLVLAVPNVIRYTLRGQNYLEILYREDLKDILLCTYKSPFSMLWFLYALFFLELFSWVLVHFLPEVWGLAVTVAGSVVIAAVRSFGFDKPVPFSLDAALLCAPFFFLGVIVHRKRLLQSGFFRGRGPCLAAAAAFAGMMLLIAVTDNCAFVYCTKVGNPLIFYVCALLGLYAALVLCCTVKTNRFFEHCGRYSLYIYGLHELLMLPRIAQRLAPANAFLGDVLAVLLATGVVLTLLVVLAVIRKLRELLARKSS